MAQRNSLLGPDRRAPGLPRTAAAFAAALIAMGAPLVDAVGQTADLLAGRVPGSLASPWPGMDVTRAALQERGLAYGLVYTGEVLGNVSGGVRQGATYEGKLEAMIELDLERLAGLPGLGLFANGFQIHRTAGLRDDHYLANVTISNIEAFPSTRLSELWLEQRWADGRASLRVGQLAADAEFFISDYGKFFIDSDWPTITSVNLPSGGPAYPLATPGIRLRLDPRPDLATFLALFNGDPGNPATIDRSGTRFGLTDPPMLIGEVQYRYNQARDDAGLSGILRLGAWHYFGSFDDPRFDRDGRRLADAASTGRPGRLRGNEGIYGIVDQQVYRPPGGGPQSGVTVFSRISGSPSRSSLVDFYLDGGVVVTGMVPGRPADQVGATFIYNHIAGRPRDADRDLLDAGVSQPVRDYEAVIEVSYLAQIVPGWSVQPDVQYVFHPGGHIPDPRAPASAIRSGALLGVRTTVSY